jgi:hypothetical protein
MLFLNHCCKNTIVVFVMEFLLIRKGNRSSELSLLLYYTESEGLTPLIPFWEVQSENLASLRETVFLFPILTKAYFQRLEKEKPTLLRRFLLCGE